MQSGRRIVGLRHDVDTVYGLRWGLPKIISIEKKYDVKSTFFVRVDVIRSDKDKRALKKIADEGWEIGLHLINTINDSRLMSSEGELRLLKKLLDVPIYGVTSAVELSERRKAIKSLRRIYCNSLARMGLQWFLNIQKDL